MSIEDWSPTQTPNYKETVRFLREAGVADEHPELIDELPFDCAAEEILEVCDEAGMDLHTCCACHSFMWEKKPGLAIIESTSNNAFPIFYQDASEMGRLTSLLGPNLWLVTAIIKQQGFCLPIEGIEASWHQLDAPYKGVYFTDRNPV